MVSVGLSWRIQSDLSWREAFCLAVICWQRDCFHHATSVARGRLTFRLRKKIFSFHRNDKNRAASVETTCHRERSVAICWQLVRRLLLSFHSIAMTSCWQVRECHGERVLASQSSVKLIKKSLQVKKSKASC